MEHAGFARVPTRQAQVPQRPEEFCLRDVGHNLRRADAGRQHEVQPAFVHLLVVAHELQLRGGGQVVHRRQRAELRDGARQSCRGPLTPARRAPTAIAQAASMPYATASPCSNRRYCVPASSACPTVWPKFSTRRPPASRSSPATMAPLIRQQAAMTGVSAAASRLVSGPRSRLHLLEQCGVARHAVLDDLVQPGPELAAGQRCEHARDR